jgi:hypothetical protein
MLDVHEPHETVRPRRDFFTHIAIGRGSSTLFPIRNQC